MISNKKDKEYIRVALILEIVGRPAEHLTATLKDIIKQIEEEKGVEVMEKIINEPILIKDQKDFYTTFAEVEVEVEDILYLAILMFKYMPAHVEVISPEMISLTNSGWNDIFNELARRLHSYDEVAGVLNMEKQILEKKLREVLGQNAKETPKQEVKEEATTEETPFKRGQSKKAKRQKNN